MTIQILSETDYIRQRIQPRHADRDYLHLSDLLVAITDLIPRGLNRVLDYGCGGSPYRSLFNASTYHRADFKGGSGLDFEFDESSKLPVGEAEYDCVLSSQVLEHVLSPMDYLRECRRVMKPDGLLILSTHGLYEDHACPGDYWRWTAMGLQRLVESAGFKVENIKKLTTGPRAAVFFGERAAFGSAYWHVKRRRRLALLGLRLLQSVGARRRHEACDICFPQNRVVNINEDGHDTYIAIALTARPASV